MECLPGCFWFAAGRRTPGFRSFILPYLGFMDFRGCMTLSSTRAGWTVSVDFFLCYLVLGRPSSWQQVNAWIYFGMQLLSLSSV